MANRHAFRNGSDGIKRLTYGIKYELSLEDLAQILSHMVRLYGGLEVLEGWAYTATNQAVRDHLMAYGETCLVSDADEEIQDRVRKHIEKLWG